eukprot:TRINITY_DN965_c0_g6_i1.p2 TRINITY_DN965_c0_g6~~TRINITY_DN965_c0_g6_i1.p2  ORF type:complete len:101 (+),score=17.83 TRINITY_DN965_c0_g6_i1:124-426(+)
MGEIVNLIKSFIADNDVAIFSKTYCPYCTQVKGVFAGLGVKPAVLELDKRDDGSKIQNALSEMVNRRTVPQVFVRGQHLGGCDDTVALHQRGELVKLIQG